MNVSTRFFERQIVRKTHVSTAKPGFAGPGHTAVEVFGPARLADTDPFVLLMDDTLDFTPNQPVGEAHPHAGLETVTLMLEGALNDVAEGVLEEGDVAWMTAGRGIVHNEEVTATGRARILQLWVALPRAARNSDPDLQIVLLSTLPVRREPGVEARLYSGRTGTLVSTTQNRVPMTLVDFRLAGGASVAQALPGSYTGLIYVVAGTLHVGGAELSSGEVGWLTRVDTDDTNVSLQAGADGARAILYAGAPLNEPIVQRGPFVGGSDLELAERFRAFRSGSFPRVSDITPKS